MMSRFMIFASWLAIALTAEASRDLQAAPEEARNGDTNATGEIAGQLSDPRGRITKAGKVAVFLSDADTGMPIHRETKRPIDPTFREPQFDKLWVVESDDRGLFEFQGVRPGKYRVVAQSWSGTEGFPGFDSNLEPSAFLILHGIAENVEVTPGERTAAMVRQLGNHVLKVVNDPEEEHALLLISLKPTLGDGILGPYGWGTEFRRHLVGVTQMEVPYVTIVGLPEDLPIHVGLMNYDNNPGFGAGSYAAGQREGRLRIVASWSNGHKDPPDELVELTNYLEKNQVQLHSLLDEADRRRVDAKDARGALLGLLVEDNDREVSVPGLGKKRLADVLAAYSYTKLRKSKR